MSNKVYVLFEYNGFCEESTLRGIFSSLGKVKKAFQKLNGRFCNKEKDGKDIQNLIIEIWNIDELNEHFNGKNYGFIGNVSHF